METQKQSRSGGCAPTPGSGGWNEGEAPRDGKPYVIMGRVVWADEYGGGSNPFLAEGHHVTRDGWSGWVDTYGLAISPDIRDTLHVDYWIALPNDRPLATPPLTTTDDDQP